VANLASSTRSAAQVTYSAYKRQPIRWRLAGGSAALTLVILLGFAVIVGTLTTRAIYKDFNRQVASAADRLQQRLVYTYKSTNDAGAQFERKIDLNAYASSNNAAIRVVYSNGRWFDGSANAPDWGPPEASPRDIDGWRVEAREETLWDPVVRQAYTAYVQYGRRVSDIQATANRVRLFLGLGVLGGAALALLAGLATARRAMEPIAELTEAAREIERTRDASLKLPRPIADDEVAELATTLESMLRALDEARAETEATLTRQREFVADASHELRTPLTSVLANLELLEETLEGDQKDAAQSALRSSKRMRRLVADLLLLARADAGREIVRRAVDLSDVVANAAAELEPVAGDHEISISAPAGLEVEGVQDELHRLVLNLMENALRHTDPGTAVEASVERVNGHVVLAVEDDGPGIPDELREKVFERFFRAHGDRSGSSGLGLAIVKAVAESHHGRVTLEPPLDGRGARFVVRFPAHA
jgi:two-component system OmpR family sensor kinase